MPAKKPTQSLYRVTRRVPLRRRDRTVMVHVWIVLSDSLSQAIRDVQHTFLPEEKRDGRWGSEKVSNVASVNCYSSAPLPEELEERRKKYKD